jgi:hypothetical protein
MPQDQTGSVKPSADNYLGVSAEVCRFPQGNIDFPSNPTITFTP